MPESTNAASQTETPSEDGRAIYAIRPGVVRITGRKLKADETTIRLTPREAEYPLQAGDLVKGRTWPKAKAASETGASVPATDKTPVG